MMEKFYPFQLILAFISVLPVFIQNDIPDTLYSITDSLEKSFDLFLNNDILEFSLWFDITEYTRKNPKEEYLDGFYNLFNDRNTIVYEIFKNCKDY
jgi:hypothetical protein